MKKTNWISTKEEQPEGDNKLYWVYLGRYKYITAAYYHKISGWDIRHPVDVTYWAELEKPKPPKL